MDPSLLLPKLKLTTLSLLLFNTFCPFSFANSNDHNNLVFLPTQGTQVTLPFVNLLNESFDSSYAGDSFSMPNNMVLARLLNMGSLNSSYRPWLNGVILPTLDGTSPGNNTGLLEHYSMKFVVYDMRLRKLQINAVDMSFNVQLQIFLQWEEWMTINTEKARIYDPNTSCAYACDSTQPMDLCCDDLWVPKFRLPNTDVTRMDSILSDGSLGWYHMIPGTLDCMFNQTAGKDSGKANCYHQRFWELSVDAKRDANMNFKNFPFDVQELSIDIKNPYSSRTWFQLAPGSLEQSASNLIQEISKDIIPLGWRIIDVIVLPLCDVASWKPTFLALDNYLFRGTINESQEKDIEINLNKSCPKLFSWTPTDVANLDPFLMYENIRNNYSVRLNYTQNAYIKCVIENGSVYRGNERNYLDFWINVSDPRFHNKVSLPCLVDAVRNLTTPGIKVTILVKRYTMHYILKLVIPTIVCVGFAFTTIAINVNDVANRLMVVVPAAIALSTLQATVVATDLPVVSYIVPSTWLVMLSYVIQLLICFESMLVYKMGYSKSGEPKVHFECAQFKWETRQIDFFLMGMLFILYTVIVFVCMLIPVANVHQTDLLSNGISIWNASNNIV